MDVIIIFNGLGNQMSQYAFYLNKKNISKSTRFIFSKKSRTIHNGYELDRVFGIKYHDSLINKFLYLTFRVAGYKKHAFISKSAIRFLNFLGVKIINENDDYDFKPQYLRSSKGIKFYVGGWHSEKYFMAIKDTILKTFQFNPENIGIEINKHTIHLMGMVSSQNEKNDAETVAWICLPDATEVINDLKVDEENESTEVFEF